MPIRCNKAVHQRLPTTWWQLTSIWLLVEISHEVCYLSRLRRTRLVPPKSLTMPSTMLPRVHNPSPSVNQTTQQDPSYDLLSFCTPTGASSTASEVNLLWKLSHLGAGTVDRLFTSDLSQALHRFRDVTTCVDAYLADVFGAYKSISDLPRTGPFLGDMPLAQSSVAGESDSQKLAAIDRKLDAILDAITASKLEVLHSIEYSRIKPIISYLETLKGYFKAELNYVQVTDYERIQRLENDNEEMSYLQESRLPKPGTLYTLLHDIINQELAVPKDANDPTAAILLNLLVTSCETYFLTAQFLLKYYSQLALAYYRQADTENFNKYHLMAMDSFRDYLTENQLGLIHKTEKTLHEAESSGHASPETLAFIRNSTRLLRDLQVKLEAIAYSLPTELPKKITEKLDFSASRIPTPSGKWIDYRKVSYAIQYRDEETGTLTTVSKWTPYFTIRGRAHPLVAVPRDHAGRTRIIFRRFTDAFKDSEELPELAAILTDSKETTFWDIDRDLFNCANEPNEDLALEMISPFLKANANVNAVFEKDKRPLHMAAQNGNLRLFERLMLKKAKVDCYDYNGYTPFHNAAYKRQVAFVREVLRKRLIKSDLRALNGFTPLHSAVMSGSEAIVAVFTESRETNLEAKSARGLTPLHLAALNGFPDIVSTLLDAKADVNARTSHGLTPLDLAIKNHHLEIVELLLSSPDINVNLQDYWAKLSPLHLTAMIGQSSLAVRLIERGAHVDSLAWEKRTPLHLAIQYNTSVVGVLVDSGANGNALAGRWSPLQLSLIYRNQHAALELLKNHEVDVNATEPMTKLTALHLAANANVDKVTSKLLDAGAALEAQAEAKQTPLHVAAIANSDQVLRLLLQAGANVSSTTADGLTALELTKKLGNRECQMMLEDFTAGRSIEDGSAEKHPQVQVTSGTLRPQSAINSVVAAAKDTVSGVWEFISGSWTTTTAPAIGGPGLTLPTLPQLQPNLNGTLLLLDLLIRRWTGNEVMREENAKPIEMTAELEARAIALNVSDCQPEADSSFERYLNVYRQIRRGEGHWSRRSETMLT